MKSFGYITAQNVVYKTFNSTSDLTGFMLESFKRNLNLFKTRSVS